eukprot:UC1_evm1s384
MPLSREDLVLMDDAGAGFLSRMSLPEPKQYLSRAARRKQERRDFLDQKGGDGRLEYAAGGKRVVGKEGQQEVIKEEEEEGNNIANAPRVARGQWLPQADDTRLPIKVDNRLRSAPQRDVMVAPEKRKTSAASRGKATASGGGGSSSGSEEENEQEPEQEQDREQPLSNRERKRRRKLQLQQRQEGELAATATEAEEGGGGAADGRKKNRDGKGKLKGKSAAAQSTPPLSMADDGGAEDGPPGVDATPAERLAWYKEQIAVACSEVLQDPENSLGQLRALGLLCACSDPRVGQAVSRLAVASLAAVYRDILPSYRIRGPTKTSVGQKLAKDTKRLEDYEQGLLAAYQRFLQRLYKAVARWRSQ